MRNETFSDYKDPTKFAVSNYRRVGHSLSNKWRQVLDSKSATAWEAYEKGAGLGGGTVAGFSALSIAAGAGGVFATAMTGGAATMALALIGLTVAAKSAYSNRESAHDKLMKHVWSFIDDDPPEEITAANKNDVGAAALSLISDGQAQVRVMDTKFAQREKAFNEFWREYERISMWHAVYSSKQFRAFKEDEVATFLVRAEENRTKLLEKAFGANGAVGEYMRRLAHFGNYLQAPVVLGKVLQNDTTPLADLPNMPPVRQRLKDIAKRIQDDQATFDKVNR